MQLLFTPYSTQLLAANDWLSVSNDSLYILNKRSHTACGLLCIIYSLVQYSPGWAALQHASGMNTGLFLLFGYRI